MSWKKFFSNSIFIGKFSSTIAIINMSDINTQKILSSGGLKSLLRLLRHRLRRISSIAGGTDTEGTINTIRGNVEIRGANLWMLFCSAVLASIGLDLNSAAVIIGAMLISPLMSPILGIGLAVGINDKNLLQLSLKNFGTAVIIGLSTGFLYFAITPLGIATPEIAARTSPTLLDVSVAFFGGMAGIIAGSRSDKTTAIPGVAIATALMPPLCTSGFGLASGDMPVFIGAFYLFFINAVFISLSTYIVVRILKFPHVELVDKNKQKRWHRWIIAFVVLVMIPSIVIFYSVIQEIRITRKIEKFIKDEISTDRTNVLRWERIEQDSISALKLYLVGERFSAPKEDKIRRSFRNSYLSHYDLRLIHLNISDEERRQFASQVTLEAIKTIELGLRQKEQQENRYDSLRTITEKIKKDSILAAQLTKEIAAFQPGVRNIMFSKRQIKIKNGSSDQTAFFVQFAGNVSSSRKRNSLRIIKQYLTPRLQNSGIEVYAVE